MMPKDFERAITHDDAALVEFFLNRPGRALYIGRRD